MIKNPDTTFLAKASGDSMIGAGINDGDTLVVDHGLTNYKDKVVIACVNGEFTVKRYKIERGRPVLKPQNPNYSDIHFTELTTITRPEAPRRQSLRLSARPHGSWDAGTYRP